MLLWVSVLVLGPVSGQFAAASKPVISLHPPWTIIFKGEAVTLTCHESHFHAAEDKKWYRWYVGTEILREIPGNTIQVRDSGEYRCQIHNSPLSDGVSLTFSSAKLILQAPPSVFEGDSVTLMCQTKRNITLTRTLYKNNKALMGLDKNFSFHIKHASLKDNGEYRCTGFEATCCSVSSNTIKIQVQELFPRPVLRAHPSPATPGYPVSLTCETQLPPQKSDVQLQFGFFRDGQCLVSGSENLLKISIPSITGSKDPPYYWCEAWTVTPSVHKESQKFQISLQIPVSRPVLTISPPGARAVEGHMVTFHCQAQRGSPRIRYQFYRGDVPLGSSSAPSAGGASFSLTLTAEHSGTYSCTADNGLGPQRSDAKSLSVTVPVSRPVLTISPPGARAVEGHMVTFHCQAQRGSPRIQYQFYRGDVPLGSSSAPSAGGASFSLTLTAEHSGTYSCTADNGFGPQRSDAKSLSVTVPASRPVLTLRTPRTRAMVGDMMELHCEAQRGSPPILYRFYHENVILGSSSAPSGGGVSFSLSLTAEHSGNYACEADNRLGAQRSEAASLSVTVPASRPVLTLKAPRTRAAVGDVMELRCEVQRGSPPILYQFYHKNVILGSDSDPSGGGASFNLSLTAEHSGNYSCEADNGLGPQRSKAVPLSVTVPASRPVLTLRAPGAQAFPGDTVELRCEAQSGSPPILYWFYHEDVTLGSSSAPSGGGASFNLSLTAEHSGNYSCEADNGLGPQRSEAVPLSVSGLTGSKSGPIATGVAGGLLSVVGLVVVALLLYCRLLRRAGGRTTSDPSRSPSDADPQEPTYYNVPGWVELQPVYSNVNPKGGDVVYSEVRTIQQGNRRAGHRCISLPCWRSEARHMPPGLMSSCCLGCAPFWRLRGRKYFLALSGFSRTPLPMAHGPFLRLQSGQWCVASL
ncbi:Fc receptor-like protein 5 [Ursus maritimus]|uniref:Fc receptor-like protein 5 n=1 Tax=Ursus maritimus TaxID=29073 RepID=A0A8M1G828_URSMA|nr:Fc receptor-like protein 5 [Ursus maritimus]